MNKLRHRGFTLIELIIFIVVVLGVFSMAPGLEKMAFLPYVPIVNVSLAIRKLFSQQANAIEYLVALGMTIGLAALVREERFSRVIVDTFPRRTVTR